MPSSSKTSIDGKGDSQGEPVTQDSIPVIPFLAESKKKRTVGRLFSTSAKQEDVAFDERQALERDQSDPGGPSLDEGQAAEDAELELGVLDCLADEILACCGTASHSDIDLLLKVIEEGIDRPAKYQIPVSLKHSSFSLVCIRKMYVLCSRGSNEQQVRNHVAKRALPMFLKKCHSMICRFSEGSQQTLLGDRHRDRPALEEIICILEVIATMTLSPDVVDSIMPQGDPVSEFVRLMRRRPEVSHRGKERTHILFLYDALCSLITCCESRVRDMVRDVMGLAGADLGFSLNINTLC